MASKLYDAHVHLADAVLLEHRDEISQTYDEIGLEHAVVVGTSPDDWPSVLEIAKRDSRLIPAVGLHPWRVNHAPSDWKDRFLRALDHGARAIGEVGLDRWVEDHDIERQTEAFTFQLEVATERNLPVSIHCLKAIGPLMELLRERPLPERGIHLHALNGPVELIPELVSLGAFFSFNAGQLKPEKTKVPERIRAVPIDRLLVETDAPDFLPPPEHREFELPDPVLCHPANLRAGYKAIAAVLGQPVDELATKVESNFLSLFGG